MKFLIDMNLSPEWVETLTCAGINAQHWSSLGKSNAPDSEIFACARDEGWVTLTQDLDFSQILFETAASGPSTVLLRLGDELDTDSRKRVVGVILQCQLELESGALLVIDERRARLRLLPLQ